MSNVKFIWALNKSVNDQMNIGCKSWTLHAKTLSGESKSALLLWEKRSLIHSKSLNCSTLACNVLMSSSWMWIFASSVSINEKLTCSPESIQATRHRNRSLSHMEWSVDLLKDNKKCQRATPIQLSSWKILQKMSRKKSKKLIASLK